MQSCTSTNPLGAMFLALVFSAGHGWSFTSPESPPTPSVDKRWDPLLAPQLAPEREQAAALIVLPFLAWNAAAFVQDTVVYHSGAVPRPYPIGGTPGRGFSNFVLLFGLVRSNVDRFPFGVFHLLIAFPVYAAFLVRAWRRPPSPARLLAACSVVIFLVVFFSRSLQENYLGVVSSLLAASVLLRAGASEVDDRGPT